MKSFLSSAVLGALAVTGAEQAAEREIQWREGECPGPYSQWGDYGPGEMVTNHGRVFRCANNSPIPSRWCAMPGFEPGVDFAWKMAWTEEGTCNPNDGVYQWARPAPRPSNKGRMELSPVADTFIDESRPNKNFGNRRSLHVRQSRRGTRETLIRFDISPNICIKHARLSLYSLTDTHSGGALFTLAPKKNSPIARTSRWKENKVSWNSIQSSMKIATVLKKLGRTEKDSWVTIDIDVTAEAKQSSQLTILLSSDGHAAKYGSKEKDGCAPKLQITLC